MSATQQTAKHEAGYRAGDAAAAFRRILGGGGPEVAIGDFLDDWRRSPHGGRARLVARPLARATSGEQARWAAYLAAVVEQLCADDGITAPAWVGSDEYRLREPWFLLPGAALRAWLLVSTPVPFKRRNIFTGDSALTRV
jgi:hypothetical protein